MPIIEFECEWLQQCPLCNKCRAAAPHFYQRCLKCIYSVDKCHHKESDIALMISRENFQMNLPDDIKQELKELFHENANRGKAGDPQNQ